MSNRILIFMSGEMGHIFFGAIKFLQEKMDCEFYPIIDRDNPTKSFYQTQKIANFKKIFFYRDSVRKFHDPDYSYLSNFENKHEVNLWSIVYMDPSFYKYDENTGFSEKEILSLLEDDCRFYEKIFTEIKPDFLIMHVGGMKHLNLLEKMSEYYKTKRLIFSPAKFGPRYQISSNYDLIDKVKDGDSSKKHESTHITNEELKAIHDKLELYNFYSKTVRVAPHLQKKNYILATLTNFFDQRKEFHTRYSNLKKNYVKSVFQLFIKQIVKYHRKKYLDKITSYTIDDKTKFVYFPLHAQPEQTITVRAPFYTNQLALIRNIARSLPINYQLYVKEHYFMGILYKWRPRSYYRQLLDMPNVKLFHPSVLSSELYEKCDLVITINGSATYESLFYRKPVIVFADTSSMDIPSVTKITDLEDLPKIIREKLFAENSDEGYKEYLESKLQESFFLDPSIFHDIFRQFFVHAGSVDDITIQKMNDFIEKHKEELELIAQRFLQKIELHKQNKIL